MKMARYAAVLLLVAGEATAVSQVRLKSGDSWSNSSGQILDMEGKTAIVLDGTVTDARIGPAIVRNAFRAVETKSDATVIKGLAISGLTATDIQRECIRLRGDVTNVLIENVNCTMQGKPQTSPNLPAGIHLETGEGIVIRDSSFNGFQMAMAPDSYWNGDGIATERAVTNVRITNVSADDNTDAGFDLKSRDTWLDNVSAKNNARNFRFWSSTRIGTITVGDTMKRGGNASMAGIWIQGGASRPVIEIDRLIVRMTRAGTIFRIEGGPIELHVRSCDIEAPEGTRFIVSGSAPEATLGNGCPAA